MHKFEATVERTGEGAGWLRITIPPAVSDSLGAGQRAYVSGRVNGFAFESMLFAGEGGGHHLMFGRRLQVGAKAGAGSVVRVELVGG
ncbi:MAG TPA: DUF1905 domain-containing protein [Urbifossiella sp.]|jgi:hypothetical protein|nr:DUF1905 domain-containing protein [Urbifossiella sp.]